MLKFSIITAVFNREDTIGRAIKSVKQQSYNNIEMIVMDGESTDGTCRVIESLIAEDDTFISEPDEGIYDALNKGIGNASGDIIGFMHSDDKYTHDNVIEKVADLFADESLDIVYGDACFFAKAHPDKIKRRYISGQLSKIRLAKGFMPAHPSIFIRQRVYDDIGMFKVYYKIAADYEFLCRVVSRGAYKAHYLTEPLVYMQLGGVSTAGIASTILLNKEVVRACRENNIHTNIFMLFLKYPFKLLQYISK